MTTVFVTSRDGIAKRVASTWGKAMEQHAAECKAIGINPAHQPGPAVVAALDAGGFSRSKGGGFYRVETHELEVE